MPPNEKSIGVVSVEIEHLQEGQKRIEDGLGSLAGKVDTVASALGDLIRFTEKHDALSLRVTNLEIESRSRADIANRGKAYMDVTKFLVPVTLAAVLTFFGWFGPQIIAVDRRIHNLELGAPKSEK